MRTRRVELERVVDIGARESRDEAAVTRMPRDRVLLPVADEQPAVAVTRALDVRGMRERRDRSTVEIPQSHALATPRHDRPAIGRECGTLHAIAVAERRDAAAV